MYLSDVPVWLFFLLYYCIEMNAGTHFFLKVTWNFEISSRSRVVIYMFSVSFWQNFLYKLKFLVLKNVISQVWSRTEISSRSFTYIFLQVWSHFFINRDNCCDTFLLNIINLTIQLITTDFTRIFLEDIKKVTFFLTVW